MSMALAAGGSTGAGDARADSPAPPSPAPRAEPKIEYQGFELANGLKVYVIEDPKAPLVYEVLWFKVGSKDEVVHRTGFAHLFEHLMFKGSAHVPDGMLDQLLEEAGGWSNAFTSSDMTVYQNVAGSNFLEQMLWLEADRMAGLLDTFDQAKLDNQRDVVLNERRQSYENQPYGMSELILQESLWPKNHGYHWSTIGYPEDLKAAQVGDVASFFKTYYVPNNATMVIAGDVKVAEVKRLVEKYFGWMPRAAVPKRPVYPTPPPITREIVRRATDDVQVPRVYLAWRGAKAYSADEPALDLAMTILGEGKSSRLYKRLVYDAKIAQDVDAEHGGEELAGTATIEVTAKPGVDGKRLIAEISDEVKKLAGKAPDALALERAKSSYESSFLTEMESTLQRAITLAGYDAQANDPSFFAKDLARYRAVTAEQVRAAAAKYLKANMRVVLTIAPGKKLEEKARPGAAAATAAGSKQAAAATSAATSSAASSAALFATSKIADWSKAPAPTAEPRFAPPRAKQRKLSNGMRLLVVENRKLPIVGMTLLVPGAGAAADPQDRLGLASFTADLLDEGAGDLSALAIAEEQDRLGADFEVFADTDAAAVAMRTLSKTLDPSIELLAKVLSQPRFDDKDVERVRGDRMTALEQRRDRPREVANLLLSGRLYGARSPYGHPVAGFAGDLRATTAADVRAFYGERWDPSKMTLVVAGDVDEQALWAKLEKTLGAWKAGAVPAGGRRVPPRPVTPATKPVTQLHASRLLVTDRPGAAQSDVRIGIIGPDRKDPRFFAFEVLRTTLGDGFTSRLTQRLREQLGITYNARATMDWRIARGPFAIGTALVTDATGVGITETLGILRELATREVPAAELEKSKQNLIRALPSELETNLATSGALATLVHLGLPLDWYEHYADGVRQVTAAQVRAAAALLPASSMVVAVVGDLAKIRAALDQLGLGAPVLHDAYGLPQPAK
jgi:zinc protease